VVLQSLEGLRGWHHTGTCQGLNSLVLSSVVTLRFLITTHISDALKDPQGPESVMLMAPVYSAKDKAGSKRGKDTSDGGWSSQAQASRVFPRWVAQDFQCVSAQGKVAT
jgi:hypothetical protein